MNSSLEEQQPHENTTTRRRFYEAFIVGTQALIGIALAVPAIAYLLAPSKPRRAAAWIETVDVNSLTPKLPVEVSFRKNRVDGWKVSNEKETAWVVKLDDSKVVAFGPQCTHLGCAYHWNKDTSEFICPCHTTLFSIDGKVISGPAPRPLDRYETKVEGNKLMLGPLRISA
jgi:menaquinol-cytochrome c reductase iron-sulfur subunit